ncbi:plasminogen-binding N-terminal domain-containing protein [Helicobacter sp. MIT 14-3879]|uniref:plasminogen-binding N-terminal domain-containing protein n=1 Tax=Helicobacter sp. MIT 14-3879 TaxID=2040649 RepID=UPI0015F18DC9|nr:plasminogen-binding N-terminal domain-containing protein [Helicobacter sp. MIT 14-3879]
MKKIFWICLVLFSILNSFEVKNTLVITIPKQEDSKDSSIKIPAFDLQKGDSGIITREVDNNEFILFNVEVINVVNGIAELKLIEFNSMNEEYLPKPIGVVKEGDKAIFRILYDRAILIAPNQNSYQEVLDLNKNIDFLHSDVFATFLAKNNINMPNTDDFKSFCSRFDVGLVFIVGKNDITTLNCQSFNILEQVSYTLKDNIVKLPFYTRLSDGVIQEIFNIKKFSDYYMYFNNLIYSKNLTKQSK